MSGNGNQVPQAQTQRGAGAYPRATTPHNELNWHHIGPECYHPSGAAGGTFMTGASSAQSSAQSMRGQPAPQPSAPPAPPQDISKTTMAGPSYVASQNQTAPSRPQYQNFPYRGSQHGNRPTNHPRQQQPFIGSSGTTATGAVMYHPTLVFPPHMGIPQTYQQPRSTTPGYYQYVGPYISYTTPAGHTPPYFYSSNGQQMCGSTVGGTGRGTSGALVPQQPPAPTAPNALPHQQPQPHIHPAITGIRQAPPKRTSHRLAIINPLTKQDIFSEINSSDSQYVSGDSSERQTPQPESTHSAVEEFVKRVSEVANQPSASESASKLNYVSKNVEVPVITPSSNNQPQTKAIITINSNILKSDNINDNESKTLGSEIIEINETPIVSAISDSPVVVPKMTINVKQTQKITEPTQPLFIDSKNLTNNNKENKYKPVVPQDEIEKQSDSVEFIIPQTTSEQMVVIAKCVQSSATIASPVNVSISSSTVTPVVHSQTLPAPAPVLVPMPVPLSLLPTFTPQPQRIREPRERMRSEDKDINPGPKAIAQDYTLLCNGPTTVEISSVDSLLDAINPPTSQVTENLETEIKVINQLFTTHETELSNAQNPEVVNCRESRLPVKSTPTATELLSASIEKVAKEQLLSEVSFNKEESIAILAQAKLTQSIASVARNHPEPMMKDLNNSKTSDPDTANGNSAEVNKNETEKDNVPINEKAIKNSKNSNKKTSKQTVANNEANKSELHENGKDETDNVSKEEQEQNLSQEEQSTAVEPAPGSPVFVPKYKYSDDQWSPLNKSGKKYYDIGLLMQIKDDPQSKNKPNAPLLETCNVIKSPVPEMMNFNPFLRPVNDALFPNFLKNSGSIRTNAPRDPKKDGRVITPGGKGSVKLPSSSSSSHKNVIHVSLSLREDVKLSQTKDAWRPTRFKKDNVTEEEYRTQELYKKFRGILNKLTPQKFDTLLDRVKTLEINTQARLEGVIDLIFQKAIDEPNFSEAYAAMCSKLSMLKVPANNDPEQCVNFRGLIISRCQKQFITEEVDENILKLEKELAECADSAKKRELHLMIEEENRRVRMKSVGNVRFIGELYKLKMLTSKIMVYCMTYLIEKLEEEKLECLCKLLTTIGEQVESEVKEQLESVFKKMQDIVERKSNKITSRVRFMLQDVIELKRRKWVTKNVVDSQPKMMDQIQKEAEQQQRHIELMNSTPMGGGGGSGGGGFRRDEGGRGKRGGDRRQGSNTFMDNQWKMPRAPNYTVDTSKLKAVTQKNLNNIKLAPHNSGWNYGSGTKTPAQTSSTSMISITKNMYSMLENVQADPTSLRTNKDLNPSYQHSKSIERSTFNSRGDFNNDSGSRSGSIGVSRSNSSSRNSTAPATPAPETAPATPLPQEPLPESKKKIVKTLVMDNFVNPNDEGLLADFTQAFPAHYHAAVVTEILNVALEKSVKEINAIIKALLLLVSTGTIASENFIMGMNEILEFAPDLYIDIPMLYEYLGKLIAPHIEKKHITFIQTYRFSENIIASNHGHMFLKAILRDLKDSMGQFFVKTKWQESGLELKQWMTEEQVPKWIENNRFEFLEGGNSIEDSKKILTPNETQSKLLQLMNTDENCDCIRGWVQDNLGVSSNEDWFMRALIQAICEHALYGSEGRDVPHFSHERINKYASLINDFGESRDQREASCLFGIQQLIHRLVHPQGLTLEIFQYLHEQYIISVEGFITWEDSEKEPEGKAVMLKALTSFFTNIREADNEESCSED